MYGKEIIRTLPCYHCVHCIGEDDMVKGTFKKRKCELSNRWGSMNKAHICKCFENKNRSSSVETFNGYRIRKDQIEDYRTANQWREAGFEIKSGEVATKMYSRRSSAENNGRLYEYFLPNQVVKISAERDPFYSQSNIGKIWTK